MKTFTLICLLTVISLIFSCAKTSETDRISKLASLKNNLQENMNKTPYRETQHIALKNYFRELAEFTLEMKDNVKLSTSVNTATEKFSIDKICEQTLVGYNTWNLIMKNCTKNDFFICSEEVRSYPLILSAFLSTLNENNKLKFQKSSNCIKSKQ